MYIYTFLFGPNWLLSLFDMDWKMCLSLSRPFIAENIESAFHVDLDLHVAIFSLSSESQQLSCFFAVIILAFVMSLKWAALSYFAGEQNDVKSCYYVSVLSA